MVKGYINVYCPEHPYAAKSGMIAVHRLIIEAKIGRYLTNNEVGHHKNKNKTDNRYENLELLKKNEHRKLHAKDNLYKLGYKKYQTKITEIIKLRGQGLFAFQIAEKLNISRRTVQRYLQLADLGRKIGIKLRKRNNRGQFI